MFLELNQQAYFYLEVWSLLDLLGLLLWGTFNFILFLVSLQSPQLLLNPPALLPHLFSVLLIEEGKLSSVTTRRHNKTYLTFISVNIFIVGSVLADKPYLLKSSLGGKKIMLWL